jgi:hypothetical protein
VRERRDPLDAHDVSATGGHHRGLVPGAGADVEGSVPEMQLERLDDHCDHERLADRLPGSVDRQRPVRVGVLTVTLEDEFLPGHARHRVEHLPRADTVLDQRRHHAITIRRGG